MDRVCESQLRVFGELRVGKRKGWDWNRDRGLKKGDGGLLSLEEKDLHLQFIECTGSTSHLF